MRENPVSPRWGTTTKAMVALALLMLAAFVLWRLGHLLPLILLAAILSFLVVPIVQFLHLRLRLPWGLGTNLVMLGVVLVIVGASTATGVTVIAQLQALLLIVVRFFGDLPALLTSIGPVDYAIGPWSIDLSQFDLAALGDQLLATIQPLLGEASGLIASFATGAIETLTRLFFIIAISYFMTYDYRQIRKVLLGVSVPGYEEDFQRLRISLSRIWRAFLRGQLLVVLLTGIMTWMLMSILGLRFSLGLGVLGGIAKFAPIVGPTSAGLIAALVALFQPGNWLGMTPLGHAVLVVVSVIVLDQAIDYLLIPRIMGTSLRLHPVIILIGLLIGATLAGVLGLLLSSPTMASLILLGRYAYRKMFDLPPWDPPPDILQSVPIQDPLLLRALRRVQDRFRRPG